MSTSRFVVTGRAVSDSNPRWRAELERVRAAVGPLARPFVTVSFAMSEDHCLSATKGSPSRVSGDATLQVTHELRTTHGALLVGVGTVISDDPVLTTRLAPGPSPRRVVLDSRLRVPVTARVLGSTAEPALLMTTLHATHARERALREAGAEVVRIKSCASGVDLPAMLTALHERGVSTLMVEGGATVLESFFASGLIDFLVVTVSPRRLDNPDAVRLGPRARAALAGWKVPPESVTVDTLLSGALHPAQRVAV